MYWPIGASRVYATGVQDAAGHTYTESDDGTLAGTSQRRAREREDTTSLQSTGDQVLSRQRSRERQDASSNQDERPELRIEHPKSHNGHGRSNGKRINSSAICGISITRQGHLFATITSTRLTIWQTQVRPPLKWRTQDDSC